jgi:hypothetical protein
MHGPLKPVPIGNQQDERSNAPHDAKDRHERPLPVRDKIACCLDQDSSDHCSYLSASIGSMTEAMNAG